MNRKSILKILFIILCLFSSHRAKSQIDLEWGDPRRDDSVMVLDVYNIKNVDLFPILDLGGLGLLPSGSTSITGLFAQ